MVSGKRRDSRTGAACWIACLLVGLGALPSAAVPGPGAPCAGKTGVRPRVRFDFRAGVDVRRFRQFPGRSVSALTGDASLDAQQLVEVRLRAYKDALEQVTRLHGVSYRGASERYTAALRALVTAGDQSVLRRDIRPLLERETEDWGKCLYVYEVVLGVRVETRLEELESPLQAAVDDYLRRFPEQTDSLDINMADLLRHLRQDQRFTESVAEAWRDERRQEAFLYKDDDTQMFLASVAKREIKISHYERGQYRPSTVLTALLLRAVRPRLDAMLRQYKRVGVTCVGSTDRLAITRGLPYDGAGRSTTTGVGLVLHSSSGKPLGPVLESNLELSFARAHEALVILAEGLPPNPRLSLRYLGRGEEHGPTQDDPYSRKITIEIRGHERYQ